MYSAVIVRRPIFQITNILRSGPGAFAAGGGRRVHGVCADQRRPADAAGVLPRHTHGLEGGTQEGGQARAVCRAKPAVADPLCEVWGSN